jgi:uncharacterized membrane protein YozB (DUF420 family)
MIAVTDLPTVNASLNATTFVLLCTGWALIRSGRRQAHRKVMLAALSCSLLFLTSYLIYHFQVGSVRFPKTGTIRAVYLTILFTHTVLAAALVPMIVITVSRAWKQRFDRHRRIARWTLPVWLYVSITGVVVYWMLYRM